MNEAPPTNTIQFVLRSSGAVTVATVVSMIATAANSFMLAAILGPAGMGTVTLLITVPTILLIVLNWGLNSASIYYLGHEKYVPSDVVSSVTWMGSAISLVIIGLGYVLLPTARLLMPGVGNAAIMLAFAAVLPQMLQLYFADIFIALDRLPAAVVVRVLPGVLYLASSLVLVLALGYGIGGAITAYFIGILGGPVVGIILLLRLDLLKAKLNLAFARDAIAFGTRTNIAEAAQYLVYRVDLPLVGYFVGLEAAGYYSVAVRLAELLWLPAISIKTVLLRTVSASSDHTTANITARLSRNLLVFGSAASVVVVIASILIVRTFLPQYTPSIPMLWLLLPGAVASQAFRVLTADVTGRGHPGRLAGVTVLGLVVALTLYLLLIPRFGAEGAAAGSTIVYLLEFAAIVVLVSRLTTLRVRELIVPSRRDLMQIWQLAVRGLSVMKAVALKGKQP